MEIKDLLGSEPIAESVKETIHTGLEGISAFMSLVFKPGLEELGVMARDRIRYWRLKNIISIMEKAKGKIGFDGKELQLQANARVGLEIIEEGSKIDNPELQEMWAGLFVSSCSEDGQDDSNIIFVDILKRLSHVEARILKYVCENCGTIEIAGFITARAFEVDLDTLYKETQIDDIVRLDREIDHLYSLSLFQENFWGSGDGIQIEEDKIKDKVNLWPSSMALSLFYKTNAINQAPVEFWENMNKDRGYM